VRFLFFIPISGQMSNGLVNTAEGRGRGTRAFTLVEVVIAVAIFTFAVVAMLGLMTVAMRSTHKADTQASSAAIVTTVMGQLTSQNFTNTVASLPFTDYFTHEGAQTNAAAAVYKCAVTDVSPAASPTTFLHQVQLMISWPAPVYTQTNVVVGSFVKYD
jgi:uncharacterized protein (TIGR02598 family)